MYGASPVACDAAAGRVVQTGPFAAASPLLGLACRDLGPATCRRDATSFSMNLFRFRLRAARRMLLGAQGQKGAQDANAEKGQDFFIDFGALPAVDAPAYAQCAWRACKGGGGR
jgi:hypothetical protein